MTRNIEVQLKHITQTRQVRYETQQRHTSSKTSNKCETVTGQVKHEKASKRSRTCKTLKKSYTG